ncbi:cysteine--tRNA ligase [Rhodobacterales bacterium HKCCSP123]|nr:cysteine--tRNA ligase [Rhodobacterales bacterium HKCCSP123]
MVEIRLRNTRSRKVETLTPLDPAKGVRMYLCGPTVYDRAHLGNARPSILFDVLYRLLRHVSPENGWAPPVYVRNFTDVDDKINAAALARKEAGAPGTLEELIAERTEETIGWYHADMDALGNLRPTHEPRATGYIAEMVAMIETLIAEDHAYEREGHVLFRVRSFEAYGRLSGRSVDDMIAGARVEVAPFKEDPMDFVLWKPSSDDLPGWDSPWGRGRPGWHIECSAMSRALLGDVFDIHGGGNDLMFPHHENEIAQSCCANGTERMAQIWLHNEMLQVEGKKMSKSLGNFFTVRDLLNRGVRGEEIRFVFLGTHYSKTMDWTAEKRLEAELFLFGCLETIAAFGDLSRAKQLEPDAEIVAALAADLNTHLARERLRRLRDLPDADALATSLVFMGFYSWEGLEQRINELRGLDLSNYAAALSDARDAAIQTKDFTAVDALKSALTAAGVEVRMSKDGVDLVPTTNFDPSKLEGLL